MSTPGIPGSVIPRVVWIGTEDVAVQRVWPGAAPDDPLARTLRFEGTDTIGRLRAGMLHLREDAGACRTERIELAPAGRDPRLPDLAGTIGELVVHRFGRRAVVRQAHRFAKIVRPSRAGALAASSRAGHRFARAAGFAAPDVLDVDGGRVALSVVPGTPLHDLGGRLDPARWRGLWSDWASAWPALVGGTTDGLPAHTAAEERRVVCDWVRHVVDLGLLPFDASAMWAAAADVGDALTAVGSAPATGVGHRDLHDKQLLSGPDGLGLLDFDTAAVTEPALDLANLAVHAEFRVAQGLWSPAHREVVLAAVDTVAGGLAVPPDRLAAYRAATRLRVGCVYAFRPRWQSVAARWTATQLSIA